MPVINEFRPVVHEKKIFNGFCYINLDKSMSPWGKVIGDPMAGTLFEQTSISLS